MLTNVENQRGYNCLSLLRKEKHFRGLLIALSAVLIINIGILVYHASNENYSRTDTTLINSEGK